MRRRSGGSGRPDDERKFAVLTREANRRRLRNGRAAVRRLGLDRVGDGIAGADDNGWAPAHHWCPGEQPVPVTGNHITDPLNWDWNVCHT
jgi:hypothetical protein